MILTTHDHVAFYTQFIGYHQDADRLDEECGLVNYLKIVCLKLAEQPARPTTDKENEGLLNVVGHMVEEHQHTPVDKSCLQADLRPGYTNVLIWAKEQLVL